MLPKQACERRELFASTGRFRTTAHPDARKFVFAECENQQAESLRSPDGAAPPLVMLRIGCVQYLNAQPLIHGWPGAVVFDHPARLCQMLAAGELDVAFVSSFEFLRNPVYSIVDGVSVAAGGPVYSVFVAHREPMTQLSEIAIDPASATSVNLLRCLLRERQSPAQLTEGEADARLLIGDQAIRFRQQHGDAYEYLDLAAEWKRTTGLPFVFALWLIRRETEDARGIADRLRARCRGNLAALDDVIAAQ
ncbi:MAG: menaquinone biosynthesis protein, partial [Verrucomicrobiota bacterium]|nr:menaquinone biosynthesis protein [Verrucomicrobiota bacterium]